MEMNEKKSMAFIAYAEVEHQTKAMKEMCKHLFGSVNK